MRLVLDTSAAANIVLRTPVGRQLAVVLEQADLVLAPSLFHSEIGNALWKTVRFGTLTHDDALSMYDDAIALVDEFIADDTLIIQSMTSGMRHGHPVYDMVFLTLAQRFGCRLLSTDKKLLALAQCIDPALCLPQPIA